MVCRSARSANSCAKHKPGDLSPDLMALWKPVLSYYVAQMSPGQGMNASWTRLFSMNPAPIKKQSQIPGSLARAQSMSNDDGSKPRALWSVATRKRPQFGDTHARPSGADISQANEADPDRSPINKSTSRRLGYFIRPGMSTALWRSTTPFPNLRISGSRLWKNGLGRTFAKRTMTLQ